MKQWVRTSLLWLFWLGGIGLIILGATIIPVTTSLQDAGVKTLIITNFNHWSNTQQQQYINSTQSTDYYIFNITNLPAALNGTQPINVQQIGPVRCNKLIYKYNFDTSNPDIIRYNVMEQLQLLDQASIGLLNQLVVIPNPSYLGGITQVGEQLDNRTTALHPQAIPYVRSELAFTSYYISQVSMNLASTWTEPSSVLLTGLRPVFIPFYFNAMIQTIEAVTNNTQTAIVTNWAGFNPTHNSTSGSYSAASPYLATAYGFELPGTLSGYTALGVITGNNTYSLFTTTGLAIWLSALQGNTTNIGLLLQNGITTPDITLIGQWVFDLTSLYSPDALKYTAYQTVACNVINTYTQRIATMNSSSFTVASWSDIGLLQFGTGMVTTLLIDPPTQWATESISNFLNGIPTSMYNLNPSANLATQSWNNPHPQSANDIEYLELSTAVFQLGSSNTVSYASGYRSCQLTLAQSQAILDALSDVKVGSTVTGFLLTALPGLEAVYDAYSQSGNNTLTDANVSGYYAGALASFVADYPQDTPINIGSYQKLSALSPYMNQPNFYSCLTNWLTGPMSTLLTGSQSSNIQSAYGVAPANSGLFTVITVGDVLFGYTSKLNSSIPGYSGYTWNDVVSYQQYLNPIYEQPPNITTADQLAANALYTTGKQYQQYTGQINLDMIGTLVAYSGTSSFQYHCDRIDPTYQHECSSDAAGYTYRAVNDMNEWNQPELISGASDGTQFQPFSEGSIQYNITVYSPETRRVLPFVYVSDYTYNGIKLRRYNNDNSTLFNGTSGTQSSNTMQNKVRNDYKYNTGSYPDGLINIASAYGGAPIVGSNPHMLYVDNTYVTGLSPDIQLHNTNIDVEPLTGKTMHVNKRLQANIEIDLAWLDLSHALRKSSMYSGIFNHQLTNTTFIPYGWVDITAAIDNQDASAFKTQIYTVRSAASIVQIVGIVVGSLQFILFSVLLYRMYRARKLANDNKVVHIGGGTYTGDE